MPASFRHQHARPQRPPAPRPLAVRINGIDYSIRGLGALTRGERATWAAWRLRALAAIRLLREAADPAEALPGVEALAAEGLALRLPTAPDTLLDALTGEQVLLATCAILAHDPPRPGPRERR